MPESEKEPTTPEELLAAYGPEYPVMYYGIVPVDKRAPGVVAPRLPLFTPPWSSDRRAMSNVPRPLDGSGLPRAWNIKIARITVATSIRLHGDVVILATEVDTPPDSPRPYGGPLIVANAEPGAPLQRLILLEVHDGDASFTHGIDPVVELLDSTQHRLYAFATVTQAPSAEGAVVDYAPVAGAIATVFDRWRDEYRASVGDNGERRLGHDVVTRASHMYEHQRVQAQAYESACLFVAIEGMGRQVVF